MANKQDIKKIVLAYSGGLDTSIIIPWLKENYNNPEIIAVAGNVGQADELEGLEAKAIATGASKLIVADLVDEMVDDVIIPALKMDAKEIDYYILKADIVRYNGDGGNYDDADAVLDLAANLNPDYAPMLLAKAHLLIAQRKNEDAVRTINAIVMNDASNAEALLLRGWVYKYRMQKADLAKSDFEKMLLNGEGLTSLRGFALHELGRADEARAWAKEIINANAAPGGEAYYYAAALLSDMDDNDQAYKYLESGLAYGFGSAFELKVNEDPYVNLKLVRRHPDFGKLVDQYGSNFVEQ